MDDERRSQLVGLAGSLLLHAPIVVLFLLAAPFGGAPPHRSNGKDDSIVVTLLPLDGQSASRSSAPQPEPDNPDYASETTPALAGRKSVLAAPGISSSPESLPIEASAGPGPSQGSTSPQATAADIRFYQRALLEHIERYRGYPSAERAQRIEGIVLVRFAMTRQGSVLDAWVDRSSGVTALDDEAIATVRRAQPLPMIPASLPDRLSIVLPVAFSVQ